jgi:succinate dehydrogenase / fumarate reductase cytochrome b subunit
LLSLWIISLATGADEFQSVKGFIGSFIGRVLLLGWTFSLFFHLFNGVRHLYWDMAKGLELKSVYTSGYITLAASAVLTLLVWIIGYTS